MEKSQIDIKLLFGIIGESYFHLNQIDSALEYIQISYDLDKNDADHWVIPYFYMAHINSKKEQFKEALGYYRDGIRVSYATVDLIDGYVGIADVFKKTGQADSSIYYANKAFAAGQKASLLTPKLIEASSLLTEIYTAKHNQDSAFKYQGIMLAMKDSLFSREKVKQMENLSFNEQMRQQEILAEQEHWRNKIKIFALLTGLFIVLLIAFMLWRNNRHKQKAYALLHKQKQETDIQKAKAEKTLEELRATQSQLIQSEKMASLGELTAGIAHEIQNPLNFINNFSEVNSELIDELHDERKKQNRDFKNEDDILNDIKENEQLISFHGKRADAIVKGILQHSRTSSGQKELTDINALTDEYLRLAYHGLRAKDKSFNATMKTNFDETIGNINIIPQDIGRVILNLITNAFYAAPLPPEGGFKDPAYKHEPTVWVSTKKVGDKVQISIRDNGPGIPSHIVDKIFQPFFTTKPTGEGTGLGLSLSYDIVKAHGGELKVETKEGEGAEFTINLPV
jgi:signal transduction histidine kinase